METEPEICNGYGEYHLNNKTMCNKCAKSYNKILKTKLDSKKQYNIHTVIIQECHICWKPATKYSQIDPDVTPIWICANEECLMKLFILLHPR